jgi:hypothetical protein
LKYFVSIFHLFLVILLTVLTQIGGIVYLLSWLLFRLFVRKYLTNKYWTAIVKLLTFVFLYLVVILLMMPPIARKYGRVPLPFVETNNIKPVTIWTALLNRNYVKPELRTAAYSVAAKMERKYPGTVLNYMDANFPFIDGFLLVPHLSHNDGEKLDIAFFYVDKTTGEPTDNTLSPIGYGGSEPPRKGEPDRPAACAGYWKYSLMYGVVPLSDQLVFDPLRTREMIRLFLADKNIGRIFLEPHLKVRFKLNDSKIGLHACYSVRHDDHVHVQLY